MSRLLLERRHPWQKDRAPSDLTSIKFGLQDAPASTTSGTARPACRCCPLSPAIVTAPTWGGAAVLCQRTRSHFLIWRSISAHRAGGHFKEVSIGDAVLQQRLHV